MKRFIFLFVAIFIAELSTFSQQQTNGKYRISSTITTSFQYNMLIGEDQQLLLTHPKALGSGVYDFSGLYSVIGIWFYNPNKQPIGLGFIPALKVSKFRFVDNYKIFNNTFSLDVENNHIFYDGYLYRDGSKLVVKKLFLPLVIYFPISKWINSMNRTVGVYMMPFFETYIYGYHKLFFHDANNKLQKIKTPNTTIREMINPNNYGIRAGIKLKHLYLFGQYTFLNFFRKQTGLNVNELNIGMGIDWFSWLYDSIDKDTKKNKKNVTTTSL